MQTSLTVKLVDRYEIHRIYVAALLLLAPVFSGCMGDGQTESKDVEEEHWLPRVEDRSNLRRAKTTFLARYQ